MMVHFLVFSYVVAWRTIFLDDFWIYFAQSKTIGSSVIVSCTSIGTMVYLTIPFIYSYLYTELWVLVVKSGVMRGVYIYT